MRHYRNHFVTLGHGNADRRREVWTLAQSRAGIDSSSAPREDGTPWIFQT